MSIVHLLSLVKAGRLNKRSGGFVGATCNQVKCGSAANIPGKLSSALLLPWASPAEEKYTRVSHLTLKLSSVGTLLPKLRGSHTHSHIPSPSEAVQHHSARKQRAPPAWILPLIPLHRPDWILAAKAFRSVGPGWRRVNRQWGQFAKCSDTLSLWCSR